MPRRPGLFVTLDGPSGVGKTTVVGLVGELLAGVGIGVLVTATPSSSSLGMLARRSTYDIRGLALTLLVAADRYHHATNVVEPGMVQDAVVVCDRYVVSAFVLDVADGSDHDLVWALYQRIRVPDIAFVLLAAPDVCAARAAVRGTYSRFQDRDHLPPTRERVLFDRALTYLRDRHYPVAVYDIGSRNAHQVATHVVETILAAKGKAP